MVNYYDLLVEAEKAVAGAGVLGDANGDGVVNTLDALMVLQYFVGMIDKFPIQN
jgi:hypothetical protein